MRKHIVAGIAAGLFSVAAAATPAAAGSGHHHDDGDWDDCPHNAVCLWKGKHFDGPMTVHYNPGPNCDEAPNWKIGSVVNNLDETIYLYSDWDCDDLKEVVHPGEADHWTHAHSWL